MFAKSRPHDLPEFDQGLVVTQAAHDYILSSLQKSQKPALGLRIGVKKAGCSGYEYVLEYAYEESLTKLDYRFDYPVNNTEFWSVIIDKETYLKFFKGGTELDFTTDGLNQGLKFNNPNVGHQCGCGESFTLVDEQ